MAEPVGSLMVEVAANVARIRDDMAKVGGIVNAAAAKMQRSFDALGGTVRNVFALLAGGMVLNAIKQFIAFGDEISDTSKRLGINAETLQEWRYAVQLSGGEAEDLTKAIEKFQRTLGEVKMGLFTEGVTKANEALGKLGLRMSDLQGLSNEDQFKLVIDRIRAIPNHAQQAAIAFELFGRSASKIMNVVRGGSEALTAAGEEARRFGLILSADVIKKADEANDELFRMGLALKSAGTNLASEMLPALTVFREILTSPGFQAAVKEVGGAIGSLMEALGRFIQHSNRVRAQLDFDREMGPTITAYEERLVSLTAQFNELRAARASAFQRGLDTAAFDKAIADTTDDIANATQALRLLAAEREKLGQPLPTPPPIARQIAPRESGEAFDAHNVEQVKKALDDIRFRTLLAQREFRTLPEDFAQVAHGLGAIGNAALKAYLKGKDLPGGLLEIAKFQAILNAALMKQEMLTPFEKYTQDVEKLNFLMMTGALDVETYNRKLFALRDGLAQTTGVGLQLTGMAKGMGDAFGSAIDNAIVEFQDLKTVALGVLKQIHAQIIKTFISQPISGAITNSLGGGGTGGFLGGLFGGGETWKGAGGWTNTLTTSAKGNVFGGGKVIPFARGGLIGDAMTFPMKGGMGLAGEAGPEAIIPLKRGPDGSLGVAGGGGGGTINIDARGADIGAAERMQAAVMTLERERPGAVTQVQDAARRFPLRVRR